MSSEKATSTHSPISPPGSPSPTQIQPQSIDVLASRLGNSSLSQYHQDSTLSTATRPGSALSPISLPDDNVVNISSMLPQYHSRSMDIDADHDTNMGTLQSNSTSKKPTTSINLPFDPSSPIAVDPTALAEVPATIVTSMYRPNAFGGFEVDEGYCENDDDFSWLPSVASLRAASTPDGVKKRIYTVTLRFPSIVNDYGSVEHIDIAFVTGVFGRRWRHGRDRTRFEGLVYDAAALTFYEHFHKRSIRPLGTEPWMGYGVFHYFILPNILRFRLVGCFVYYYGSFTAWRMGITTRSIFCFIKDHVYGV
ncbi:unnamed protein product [Fusarium graminearum]|uniref:Uncharacterized protein n=1 Tax=Gibberella zeae (strain ATCC MYA-4620 / CBS 123657 / FGSC 9075 / NRRL 31084 / PH-1) TaxID=229533 RepID=A0A098D9A1_GIBZE|nr:unnamed protein product [Fusarium graminearum]